MREAAIPADEKLAKDKLGWLTVLSGYAELFCISYARLNSYPFKTQTAMKLFPQFKSALIRTTGALHIVWNGNTAWRPGSGETHALDQFLKTPIVPHGIELRFHLEIA